MDKRKSQEDAAPFRPGLSRMRGALANAGRAVRTSLAARCLAVVVAYALVLTAAMTILGRAGDALFTNAFPSMDTVIEYDDALKQDDFAALQSPELHNSQIIIFDADGARLYASSEKVATKVFASDLSFISDYDESTFYEVFQEYAEDGLRYRILWCVYDDQDGSSKTMISWCELDEGLHIVAGDLFPGRSALTQREFDLIKGVYDAQLSVERYDYVTDAGDFRSLVLLAPLVSGARYQSVLDSAGRLALLGVPIVLVVTAAAAWTLVRMARRAARPLDDAIDAYRRGDEDASTRSRVPSELVHTYDNFTALMDELRASRLERQRIIADVSHDLKTPLTVIRGYAQAFCEGLVPPEKQEAYHRAIAERAVAASELIDALSSYAQMEHPSFEPELVRRDVAALVRSVASSAEPAVEQAGDTLEVDASGEVLALIDDQLFRRMLANLIDNAWAHNDAGIRIRVSCCIDAVRDVVVVTVADTGTGFPPELAARAFEPFVTENVARAAEGGTGLGLSIARRAVELMAGSIRVDERPAVPWGAVLVVELPRA